MPVVANSSPLIYLAALSDFHLLKDLFGEMPSDPISPKRSFSRWKSDKAAR